MMYPNKSQARRNEKNSGGLAVYQKLSATLVC